MLSTNSYSVKLTYYLRQVNEVNGRDNVFIGLYVCLSLCTQRTGQSDSWGVKLLQNVVNAMDFKFDARVSRQSGYDPLNIFRKGVVGHRCHCQSDVPPPPEFFGR